VARPRPAPPLANPARELYYHKGIRMIDTSILQVDEITRRVTLKFSPKGVKGLTKLMQIVVLSLLNNPGKDILDPEVGAGIPEMIGMNIDPQDLTEILSEITRRVRKCESEVINNQIGLDLSSDERLQELRIISVAPGGNTGDVDVTLRIYNELGKHSDVVL